MKNFYYKCLICNFSFEEPIIESIPLLIYNRKKISENHVEERCPKCLSVFFIEKHGDMVMDKLTGDN